MLLPFATRNSSFVGLSVVSKLVGYIHSSEIPHDDVQLTKLPQKFLTYQDKRKIKKRKSNFNMAFCFNITHDYHWYYVKKEQNNNERSSGQEGMFKMMICDAARILFW